MESIPAPPIFKYHLALIPSGDKHHDAKFFYMDIPWDKLGSDGTQRCKQFFIKMLRNYFSNYVVGFEYSKIGKTPHVHVYTLASTKQYNAFRIKAQRTWNLRGRATANLRKQYGLVKRVIKNPDNAISYCIKSKNYEFFNYDPEYIKRRADASYQKEAPTDRAYVWDVVCKLFYG